MAASRGERRGHRRRLRGAAALLVLAAALTPLLIGSRAQSDSAPPALTTSTTAMMASDGKSAEAAWPGPDGPWLAAAGLHGPAGTTAHPDHATPGRARNFGA